MSIKLDATDLTILDALHRDGRLTNRDLAERLGIATSTTLERVRRLQKAEVIQGYRACISATALGVNLEAIIAVKLVQHTAEGFVHFKNHTMGLSEVNRLYHIGGANDYLVHVAVRDAGHLRDFIFAEFTAHSSVMHVETTLIFDWYDSEILPETPAVL